jgi:hypothetical protein
MLVPLYRKLTVLTMARNELAQLYSGTDHLESGSGMRVEPLSVRRAAP